MYPRFVLVFIWSAREADAVLCWQCFVEERMCDAVIPSRRIASAPTARFPACMWRYDPQQRVQSTRDFPATKKIHSTKLTSRKKAGTKCLSIWWCYRFNNIAYLHLLCFVPMSVCVYRFVLWYFVLQWLQPHFISRSHSCCSCCCRVNKTNRAYAIACC